MKSIVLFSFTIISLNLSAQLAKSPTPQPTATPAYVTAQKAILARSASTNSIPKSLKTHERALLIPSESLSVHKTKQQNESLSSSSLIASTALTQLDLNVVVRKKIIQLYPKFPIHAFPYVVSHEIEIQQKLLSEKSEQEITLSINTRFALEVVYRCIPFLKSKKQNLSQLQIKHTIGGIENPPIPPIFKIIKQQINTINQELYQADRPDEFYPEDYRGVCEASEVIHSLTDPKDKLLLFKRTVLKVITEEDAPAAIAPANPKG